MTQNLHKSMKISKLGIGSQLMLNLSSTYIVQTNWTREKTIVTKSSSFVKYGQQQQCINYI
jgi:hypothetical protein